MNECEPSDSQSSEESSLLTPLITALQYLVSRGFIRKELGDEGITFFLQPQIIISWYAGLGGRPGFCLLGQERAVLGRKSQIGVHSLVVVDFSGLSQAKSTCALIRCHHFFVPYFRRQSLQHQPTRFGVDGNVFVFGMFQLRMRGHSHRHRKSCLDERREYVYFFFQQWKHLLFTIRCGYGCECFLPHDSPLVDGKMPPQDSLGEACCMPWRWPHC